MSSLEHLFDRNIAWADRKTEQDPGFFRRLSEQQAPRYLWIGCSDSRITANDVLGLDPGEVFVHRNIANIVHTSDMNILAVLEYAIEVLGVRHIIVSGHYGCGGVLRAMAEERGALVDHWLQPLSMFFRKHRAAFAAMGDATFQANRLCELNVQMQLRRVAATPIVEGAWARQRELHLHGWIYGMHDGLLRDLGTEVASLAEREALPSIDQCVAVGTEPLSPRRRHALEAFSGLRLDDMASAPCCMPSLEKPSG
ncbi:carbonic anhydrase [Roseococcus sp. SDR]|uniref:Carbonic anhydrase n=1 Tax=Sediminicoccus rosea TaxID=1225128 RepID=A0ABZ0PNW4_9PROT|nr:carbonic anhydrase [Sediminicoccus rosea]MBS7792681.1 carbonic anhydrase [Roseococcus sp. SDR]MBV1847995.1 carbonic anhydrase [Roseococcus sp. SDR]WPB87157.1 carbonic anhydrase [Sediminicoccus rosea]